MMTKRVSNRLKQVLADYGIHDEPYFIKKPSFTNEQLVQIIHALLAKQHGELTDTERDTIMMRIAETA